MGRLKALWLLGWSFLVTLLGRWLPKKSGLARFRAYYADDAILPFTNEERDLFRGFARCIACAACDRGEQQRILASQGEYPGVMALVLGSARNAADFPAAHRSWSHVSLQVLAEKERVCPVDVPMRAMKEFVAAKTQELSE